VKNAYLRFGKLVYIRRSEKTTTNIRVHLDAFVGEERGKAHLVSVAGGDTEIGALAAAFANGDLFTVIDPVGKESLVSLGDRPLCFRGSILIPSRKRPLRHLVSCSQELADAQCDGKLLLVSDDEMFIWSSLVGHYGLPATPEWRPWTLEQLRRERRIQLLPGFGYAGVAVKATRKYLLALVRRGLRSKHLNFPGVVAPFPLAKRSQPREDTQGADPSSPSSDRMQEDLPIPPECMVAHPDGFGRRNRADLWGIVA